MRMMFGAAALLALAACNTETPAPAETPADAATIAENMQPTGNDLASITAVWGLTPEACAATNVAKDGLLEVSASEIIVGQAYWAIYSVDWADRTATVVTRPADDVTNRGAEVTYVLAADDAAGTLSWTNPPTGEPSVYRRCP